MIRSVFITLRLAIYSLLLHKLRTGLAVVGILIGIMAVIWLVAMGQGVSYQAQKQIEDLGARNIIVRSVKPSDQGSSAANRSFFLEYGLLRDDYQRIVTNVPQGVIEQAVAIREMRKEFRRDEYTVEGRLVGCTPEYFSLNNLRMEGGRFIEDRDGEPPDNVCVLAATTASRLFPLEDPIGKSIQIDRDFYLVIGQTTLRDPTAAIGGSLDSQDYNLDVYIPLQTLRWRVGDMVFTSRSGSREGEIVQLSQITLTIADKDQVYETAGIIRTLLEKYHPQQDFGVVVPQELLRQAKLIEMMFNILLVIIAGISLVVGGIGIMNIMLATVTERTREIGIRRALGAKRRAIIQQFLAESVVLTGVGGLLGVGCGFLVGPVLRTVREIAQRMFPDMMSALPAVIMELQPRIAWWSIAASLCISIGVGVLFGIYPALRAAYMDPIEALRHE
jgi:putative ABC transport system permease protein